MRILVGVVPDASGSDAIALAAVLQKAYGAQVVLGNIYPHAASRGGVLTNSEYIFYPVRGPRKTLMILRKSLMAELPRLRSTLIIYIMCYVRRA